MEKITLLYTTDVHGFVTSDSLFSKKPSHYGIAHVATKVREIREQEQEVIFFDNGDLISGSLLSIRCSEDQRLAVPVVTALNELECRFSVIGNHEFDFGRKYLDKVIEQSEFPWLAANIHKYSCKKPAFGPPWLMHETAQGRKIAFIGVTTPETAALAYKELLKDLKILSPLEVLKEQIKAVQDEGADLVVVCYHGGYESGLCYWQSEEEVGELSSDLARDFPEMDLLITGHTHGCVANKEINGVHTIQAGCNGMFLGRVDIEFNDYSENKISSEVIDIKNTEIDEKVMALTAKAHESTELWLTEVVARSRDSFIPSNAQDPLIKPSRMMSLIHDVLREHSKCDITVAHFWDMTGWSRGPVTRRKILNLIPNNYLHVLNITGENIKLALERTAEFFALSEDGRCLVTTKIYDYDIWSGIHYVIDISKPFGERVVTLTFNGEEVKPKDRLKAAFYHFRSGGALGYDMLRSHRPVWRSVMTVREHLFKYLRDNELLKVPIENNFRIENNGQLVDDAFLE